MYQFEGMLTKILPPVTGTSAKGMWKKQDFVVTKQDRFPVQAYFQLWNDDVDRLDTLQTGQHVIVWFSVESKEYKDRYFTNLRAHNIVAPQGMIQTPGVNQYAASTPAPQASQPQEQVQYPATPTGDDLPF